MRIATWNINGLRARLEYVLQWLSEREPDIVGLQELKLTDEQFPHDAFEALGYQAVVHGQKSWNGVAILTRLPVEATQIGLEGQADFGARPLNHSCAATAPAAQRQGRRVRIAPPAQDRPLGRGKGAGFGRHSGIGAHSQPWTTR